MAHQTTGSFSEMTYIVSGGELNSTHSLTQSHPLCSEENFNSFSFLVLGSSKLPINTNHIFLL